MYQTTIRIEDTTKDIIDEFQKKNNLGTFNKSLEALILDYKKTKEELGTLKVKHHNLEVEHDSLEEAILQKLKSEERIKKLLENR